MPLLVCIGLFIFHFSVIRKYAVNLPNWDDWAFFVGDDHPASVDLKWLHAQHNEHRTPTTKLFVWLQYHINGWNIRTHLFLNFILYGLFLAGLVWFARKLAPQVPSWVVPSFIVFLLSPIIWLEHFMAYPVAVHFWLIFFFVSAYLLFDKLQRWVPLVLGCLASLLSIYSFAAGVVTAIILLLTFAVFKCHRAYGATVKEERARELLQLLLVVVLIGGALATWFIGYHKPPHHPALVFPYTWDFWPFFLNLVSFSFGVERTSVFWGAFCLLIVLVPICGELWRKRGNLSNLQWASLAIVLGILADLAAISMGRASFGIFYSKTQEYAEHGMPLIILSVVNWSIFLSGGRKLRASFIAALWLYCLMAFHNNWNFNIYRDASVSRREGVRCAKAYYEGVGDGRCPTVYPPEISLAPFLEQAKRLNASFYREMQVGKP